MQAILTIVLIVDAIYALKFVMSGWRVSFVPALMFNEVFWARVGFLIVFHVIMLIITIALTYIGAIVSAVN